MQAINMCFVYGSLRPDDDSGQTWTKDALKGLNAQRAEVYGAQLYKDEYDHLCEISPPIIKKVIW